MGFFAPFVGKRSESKAETGEEKREISKKKVTFATALSFARPILAAHVSLRMLRGEQGVTKEAAITFATDGEGKVGAVIDWLLPNWGRGKTEFGAWIDPIADTIAGTTIAGATIAAPRTHLLGRIGAGMVGYSEYKKARWAVKADRRYQDIAGEHLDIPVRGPGAEATAEKDTALALAIFASDRDDPRERLGLSALSLYFAVVGSRRGEAERIKNIEIAREMTWNALLAQTDAAPDAIGYY